MKKRKIQVSRRAIVQRIQRKLKGRGVMLVKERFEDAFYLVDTRRNVVVEKVLDVEQKGRELGALKPWEKIASAPI